MKIIEPSYEILTPIDGKEILKRLEIAGRVCYKSEERITDDSALKFLNVICSRNHESVLEHVSISVRFICCRGFTHELVRHRIASFSQESTRYCNYSKDKFGNEITVVKPTWYDKEDRQTRIYWEVAMLRSETQYFRLLKSGLKSQDARGVLPIDLKTEIVITANLREWKHILDLRTATAAHPSMKQLMRPLLEEFQENIPVIYDDV